MNLRVILFFMLTLLMLLGSCRSKYKGRYGRKYTKPKMSTRSKSSSKFKYGRSFLSIGKKESKDYGIYSYILFSERPDSLNYPIYFNLIEAYLNKVEVVEDLEVYTQKSDVNIVYFFVKGSTLSMEMSDRTEQIDWLINNYDYARARVYLSKFPKEDLDKGPYIISCRESLSDCKPLKENYLLQDLSHVHPRVVSLWVSEFLKQSSDLEYWDDTSIDNFSNEIRNAIAIGADGLQIVTASMDWWRTNLTAWIVLK